MWSPDKTPVRLVVELARHPDGRVTGTVQGPGAGMEFAGWLDLLRLLEELAAAGAATNKQ